MIGLKALASRPGLVLGGLITGSVCFMALMSLVALPHDPALVDIGRKLLPIGSERLLGTDALGRDQLSALLRGSVASLSVAVVALLIGVLLGVPLGLLASAKRGVINQAIMRGSDVMFAFPAILVAILLRETIGPGLLNAMVAIGIFNIPVFARTTYGAALPVWTRGFVSAARLSGKRDSRIAFEHVLPLILGLILVQATIQLGLGVLAEAGLSYVGLGVQSPMPSWGRMLNEAQTLMAIAPRLALIPGCAIALTVLGFTLLGDGLRDLVDPRLGQD